MFRNFYLSECVHSDVKIIRAINIINVCFYVLKLFIADYGLPVDNENVISGWREKFWHKLLTAFVNFLNTNYKISRNLFLHLHSESCWYNRMIRRFESPQTRGDVMMSKAFLLD